MLKEIDKSKFEGKLKEVETKKNKIYRTATKEFSKILSNVSKVDDKELKERTKSHLNLLSKNCDVDIYFLKD